MKRERVIQEILKKISEYQYIEVLVSELPLNKYLRIKYKTYDGSLPKRERHNAIIEVACKINHFNKDSIQVTLLAVSSDTASSFAYHKYNKNIQTTVLKYNSIKDFRILKEEDMPLLIAFPLQYDLYRELLRS